MLINLTGFVSPASFFATYGVGGGSLSNGVGGPGAIAKPIARPAAVSAAGGQGAVFDPHLHALLSCRHPTFLPGKDKNCSWPLR